MSTPSSSPLVGRIQTLILATFDVTEIEAHNCATGMAALAEGWGDSRKAAQLDWSHRIKKDLGKRLKWRSETERERFEADEKQKVAAYEALIKRR
jgi:hypothetical protein